MGGRPYILHFYFLNSSINIFWWSIFAAVFMVLAMVVSIRRYKIQKNNKDDVSLVDDELGQNMGDLIQLEIMRVTSWG